MRRRFVQIDGELVEITADYSPEPKADHHVMPDFEPFKANDGTHIKGRAHWREHLKHTNGIEFGRTDMQAAEANHAKRKAAYDARMQRAMAAAKPADVPFREGQEYRRSSVAADVLNRLHGRPVPDRKTVIKIALEEARRRR